jgi:hypothetical protein
MASIHRQPGRPNWFCAYTTPDGKRHFKTTKTSDRAEARRVCAAIQRAADLSRSGTLTEDRARRVIESSVAEILEVSGVTFQRLTVEVFFHRLVAGEGTRG